MTTTMTRGSLKKIRDDVHFYSHQIEGVRHLARKQSFLLADEMGLGKSLISLTVAAIDYEADPNTRTLIVAPASLKWNWGQELEDRTRFAFLILDGTRKQRSEQLDIFGENEHDILICNPEQVVGHLDEINALHFDIVIVDEAHLMKSPKAKRTKAIQGIEASRFFLLTGSPLLNQVNDLWSLIYRIDPTMFPKYWGFISRHAVLGGYLDKQIVGVKHHRELVDKLNTIMLRREKKDVLDLPDKIYVPILVDLHPEQQKLYKQAVDELQITLPDRPDAMELENALTKMLRLKMICGTTACIPGYDDHSTKLDVAVDRAVEVIGNGEPVVVFTQFREVQRCMVTRLEEVGIHTFVLNGDTPIKDRVAIVQQWEAYRAHGKPAALVAMLQVAGVGLNMTAASTAIFIDVLWVPKLNEQAEDRLHRIGQGKPVTIIKIVARKSVEQRVDQILKRKTKLFGTLVGDSDKWKRALVESVMDGEF